jgi:hypothetical protein
LGRNAPLPHSLYILPFLLHLFLSPKIVAAMI